MMKIKFVIGLIFVCAAFGSGAKEPLLATNITWGGESGYIESDEHTIFSLMATGFFRAPRTNVQVVADAWLKQHPKAKVTYVSTIQPMMTKDPESKQRFVWVVDGNESLNLELVRQGCFAPGTQMLAKDQKLEVPESDYTVFLKRLSEACEYAENHHLGLWKASSE